MRAAIAVLCVRFGSMAEVAQEAGIRTRTLYRLAAEDGHPTAGLALRVAELAGVPADDVLTGAFAKPGVCPMCGRGPE